MTEIYDFCKKKKFENFFKIGWVAQNSLTITHETANMIKKVVNDCNPLTPGYKRKHTLWDKGVGDQALRVTKYMTQKHAG